MAFIHDYIGDISLLMGVQQLKKLYLTVVFSR